MKITLVCIGRTTYEPFVTAINRYCDRLKHYIPFQICEIPDIKNTRGMTEIRQKEEEGKLILDRVGKGDMMILLDERGREYTSREFSDFLGSKMNTYSGNLVFVVGGPYGFSDRVYESAKGKISLSKMTFPHEMVRVFFVEQLYRAMSIMRGEPYHHD